MEEPSRRSFLSGSLATIAGISGYGLQDDVVVNAVSTNRELTESVESVFKLVPAEAAIDGEYRTVLLADATEVESTDELTYQTRAIIEEIDALEASNVDHVVSARGSESGLFGGAVGSFDAPKPGEKHKRDGEWRIADTGEFAVASNSGQLAFAGGAEDNRVAGVEAAVDVAQDEAESVLDTTEYAATAFDRLGESRLVYLLLATDDGWLPMADNIAAVAAGFEQQPNEIEGTTENEYLLFVDGSLDKASAEQAVRELEPAQVVKLELSRTNGVVHATVVAKQPPERDREAAPTARIQAMRDGSAISFEHTGGEPVAASELELWIDGERVSEPIDGQRLASGDSFAVEADALATVTLRWLDEEQNVYYDYVQRLFGEDAFETEYDVENGQLTLTYTGDQPADPEKLAFRHRSDAASGSEPTEFDDTDELTSGESTTVAGVEMGDRVTVSLDVPARPRGSPTSLVRFHAQPPRVHIHQFGEGVTVRYHNETERDAEEFEILIGDKAVDQQFEDEYETLTRGSQLRLDDLALGEEITVEWVEPDDPVEIAREVIVPHGYVEMSYDDAKGTVDLQYREGPALNAENLSVTIDGEPASTQPNDDYQQYEPEDKLTVEAPPFSFVEMVWEREGESHEIGRTVTGEESIEASYNPDKGNVEFAYVGQQPAKPERIDVVRGSTHQSRDGSEPTAFEMEHDTLTEGDSIQITSVDVDERLSVVLTEDDQGHRTLLGFTPQPQWGFSFDERDGKIVALYRGRSTRDASSFRILVDGEESDLQPDDVHDRLEHGAEVNLGEFAAGTTLTVEWVVPEQPYEVRTHTVTPDVDFAFDLDAETGTMTIEHDGGDAVAADELTIAVHGGSEGRQRNAWTQSGSRVTEGDSVSVDIGTETDNSREIHVAVLYKNRRALDHGELELSK
ncbi:hypothetical protein [Salinibaculum salinum]|uniref:hypothetical protein n=1 Tax=Salinibaculum salinum TaxID=3131996 RepID=UPI0030EBC994